MICCLPGSSPGRHFESREDPGNEVEVGPTESDSRRGDGVGQGRRERGKGVGGGEEGDQCKGAFIRQKCSHFWVFFVL